MENVDKGMSYQVAYFLAELFRFQLINNIAKYMAPKENTRWKNPYL